MKTIRSNVFETNSSSMHTVCIEHTNEISGCFSTDSDGTILVHLSEFGWSGACTTPDQKLAYLCLLIYSISGQPHGCFWCCDSDKDFNDAADFVESTPEFKRIKEVLCKYCQCPDVKFDRDSPEEGYIDHQSYEYYKSLDEWYKDNGIVTDFDIYNFIVGESYIVIDNDNH